MKTAGGRGEADLSPDRPDQRAPRAVNRLTLTGRKRGQASSSSIRTSTPDGSKRCAANDYAFFSALSTRPIASTSSRTCAAEVASACFSPSSRVISMTRSTPPAPICTGTPT